MISPHIPREAPTQNEFKGQNRFVYKKLRSNWEFDLLHTLKAEAGRQIIPAIKTPIDFALIFYIRWYKSRQLDESNLVGGSKPVIDALKNIGVIQDDSPNHCRIEFYQRKANLDSCQIILYSVPIDIGRRLWDIK